MDDALLDDLRRISTPVADFLDADAVARVGESGDPRAAWVVADVLRFVQVGPSAVALVDALNELLELELDPFAPLAWVEVTDRLIAWDVPAPDGFADLKGHLYEQTSATWGAFFGDPDVDVDLRVVSWGGVLPDLRELDDNAPCNGCIPSLDHPAVTDAVGGDWLQDQRIVFGVVVRGEARAYPRFMMETHELVNDTLGGREIALPYCTLCGAAQAFFVGQGEDRRVLRTSGLLQRSNKIMVDLTTGTYYDTFAGTAIAGPNQGEVLEQIPVITSTWGAWKEAHPDTTILAEDGGIGFDYPEDPLQGRNLNGPIFPVGRVDARVSAEVLVLGVRIGDRSVAFPVRETRDALEAGDSVAVDGVEIRLEGSGLVAYDGDESVLSHEAFWFAWSQFNPDTAVWFPDEG
ncbi:MAG: DUF3179 domain-containing protein [Acidimicrobiia bacterium]|nr:DUF3179 domain-containing protein [Acidimicrobiia bacterium]